jgi:hypothetical protein
VRRIKVKFGASQKSERRRTGMTTQQFAAKQQGFLENGRG